KAGDRVNKYQVLAGLDARDLSIALQQAQNTFAAKDAAAKKAEDDVKDHSKDETFTQKETRTTAQVARDNAFDSIKAAQKALDDTVITSPIDGVVTQVISTSGQNVSVTDLIVQVVDISSVYFDTEVDEADISKITVGAPTEVTLDAYPDQIFQGLVDQIVPQTKTTSSGATVVTVRIIMDNPKLTFVNGLSGESSVIFKTSLNTLSIPLEALRDDNTVVVKTNNKFEAKKVGTGISSDADIEIKSGIAENETILLDPPAVGTNLNKFSK
ncbi:MAG: efflux RND transporter periplasmic adaptor subunit, partial [Candidatus Daviesbacteria bacterium]|nr:efflux RND transporter periplasmic adaptor subunit [Candidatus Daviesbacteria bacterium]